MTAAATPSHRRPRIIDGKRRWLRRGLLAGALSLELLWPGRMLALDPARDLFQYNCQTWSRQNGLPVNGIHTITQTEDGYLWLGTAAGLVRFDGLEFKLLDLTRLSQARSSTVMSLAKAQGGGLWVGLENGGFGLFDGGAFSFRGKAEWGGANMNVRTLLESKDGSLWFAAEAQAARLTPAGVYEELLGAVGGGIPNVLRAFEDSKGRVWFGTSSDGAYYWQEGKLAKLPDPALKTVISVAEDLEGQIILGTDTGLKCYDANLQPKAMALLAGEIRTLLVDRHGVLWIGTSSQGLVRYQKGIYTSLRKMDGLAGDFVTSIAEDREGSLWVGTRDGVSQLTDVKFPTQAVAQDGLAVDVGAVCASQRGGVWIGSSHGLSYFDGKIKTYAAESGLPPAAVKRVFEAANGDVYLVSGLVNLVVFSRERAVATLTAPTLVVGMAEDAQGVIVSVGSGLFRAGTNSLTPYVFTNGAPDFRWILNLAKGKDGCLWVASQHGIFRVKDGSFQQWSAAQGLADPDVQFIFEDDDGAVWAATRSGIVRLKDNQLRNMTRRDGLLDDNIYAMVPDDSGHFWVDSGRGIFRVGRQEMNDFAAGKSANIGYVAFDNPESMKPTDKSQNQEHVGCKSLDGRIWFPSSKGVVMIDPAHIPGNPLAPPVHISSLRANGVEFDHRASIVVPPGKGELEIHFAGLSLIAPHKMRFRYRLEGYDKGWVETEDRRLAFYTNLKPGRYTFRVIAANADGVWNESGDAMAMELRPHYYQTAWFDALGGGLACAALLGIYARRIRHLHHKQRDMQKARELLEAEVLSRTAELGQANRSLVREVEDHKHTEAELKQRTQALVSEIEERKRMQLEIERTHRELVETSRLAGMTEIATNVLHNVGNSLNSVNVSATLVTDSVRESKLGNLAKVAALLQEHEHDLGAFITRDPKGKQVPSYLAKLSEQLLADQQTTVREMDSLRKNIEHINEIVAMQQDYAKVSGVKEIVSIPALVEDSLRMNLGALNRHGVEVIRDFEKVPPMNVEKHKVLQILINLLRNAKYACDESGRADKRLTVRVANGRQRLKISVIDNGVGIAPENLTRIFNHGFTTRKNGHGFGLHSGALAAREMGGSLTVQSEGPGQGAAFTLELPVTSPEERP